MRCVSYGKKTKYNKKIVGRAGGGDIQNYLLTSALAGGIYIELSGHKNLVVESLSSAATDKAKN